jgi:molybdopterin molybdotransferase
MIPLKEAYAILDNALMEHRLSSVSLPVGDALGRVLYEDQHSRLDLPPFNKSAMDGYALLADDVHDEYRLIETIAAGQVGSQELVSGTAIKVMTGAAVPNGTGRVVMQEYTEEHQGTLKVHKHDGPTNICLKAEDVKVGDLVLPAGTTLGPLEIANLISCGITEVEVARQPRVAILSTGDEIVDSPGELSPGKIMNSNGPMLVLLAESYGFDVVSQETVPDQRDATVQAIRSALDRADILILSGGVSVGEFDFVMDALSDIGLKVAFSRIAVKPGKPTVLALSDSPTPRMVFGLPGNPVSSYLMFHIFVLRAIARLSGSEPPMRELNLRLGRDFKRRKTERLEFVPCRLGADGVVEAVEFHGSAHLAAVLAAQGFFLAPVGVDEIKAGSEVTFLPLPRSTG